MTRIFLNALLCLLLYVPVISLGASQETELTTQMQVVDAFQKLPHYEMFCKDEDWRKSAPTKVYDRFRPYLTNHFFELVFWSQCGQPKVPPRYDDLNNIFYWDIRFGFENGGREDMEDNVRVLAAKLNVPNKATVKVLYDFGSLKNLTTTYTLIREDGHWKIDDIAPKGDKPNLYGDTALEHSDSIKTDMQTNYDAALKHYQQEQTKQNAIPKP